LSHHPWRCLKNM